MHPLPSAINAGLVFGLALVAGSEAPVAVVLGVAMFGYQASIGSLNDLVDADRDRQAKPGSPIPAGLVSRRLAMGIAIVGGALGTAVSAAFGAAVLAAGSAGYGCGLAYDLFMRRWGWGWLCFALALPLLLVWTWLAAAGSLPRAWPILLPVAALAGPTLHLANSLADADEDRRSGTRSLTVALGVERAQRLLAALVTTVYLLAWVTLAWLAPLSVTAAVTAVGATLLAGLGVTLSRRTDSRAREAGWLVQAVGLAVLAVAWASSVEAAS